MREWVPLSAPDVGEAEIAAVEAVMRSGRLSLGPRLDEFEARACARLGAAHAVAVSSGTAGLDCALRALRIGPGDEVITAPFSFVASANAILHVGATPVFADVERDSLAIDPARIEECITERTRAVLVVHVFGRPADMSAITEIATRHRLLVIEDACEAFGARFGGRCTGTLGDVGVFGFYPNKVITTAEGGLVVAEDDEIAARCRAWANQGRRPGAGWLEHVELGVNYRLSELHAAIGVVQLDRLDEILARRDGVARRYHRLLAGVDVERPAVDLPDATTSWFVFVVRVGAGVDARRRDGVHRELAAARIATGRYFPPIHLLPPWRERSGRGPGDFPITEREANRTLALPFSGLLDEASQERVVEELERALREVERG